MAVTAKEVKDTFEEFAQLSDADVDRWRLQAEERINLVQWAGKSDTAILWLTAHLLKLQKQTKKGGTAFAGPMTQKKVGDLSASFSVPKGRLGESFLAGTTYGQYFLDLKTGIFPTRVL